jgi:ferredoxin-NADP reductase
MDALGVATRRPVPPARRPVAALPEPNATVVEREDVSASIARFRVRPDDGVPPFRPGQYFALGLVVGGRLIQRPYSTASAPDETDALEFLIRLVPTGELTPRLWPLGTGARVRLGRPKGLFTADPDDARRPLFIATGTGIAPLLSMIESRLGGGAPRRTGGQPILVHGVSRAHDLAYRRRFESLDADGALTYLPAVSRPSDPANAGWTGAIGHVHGLLPGVAATHALDPAGTVAYVCGNPDMTGAATTVLESLGMSREAVRSEAYWTPASPAAS